jgi:hypothetical protein
VKVLVYTGKGPARAEYKDRIVRIYTASEDGKTWKMVKEIEVGEPDLFPGMSDDEVAHFTAKRWIESQGQ